METNKKKKVKRILKSSKEFPKKSDEKPEAQILQTLENILERKYSKKINVGCFFLGDSNVNIFTPVKIANLPKTHKKNILFKKILDHQKEIDFKNLGLYNQLCLTERKEPEMKTYYSTPNQAYYKHSPWKKEGKKGKFSGFFQRKGKSRNKTEEVYMKTGKESSSQPQLLARSTHTHTWRGGISKFRTEEGTKPTLSNKIMTQLKGKEEEDLLPNIHNEYRKVSIFNKYTEELNEERRRSGMYQQKPRISIATKEGSKSKRNSRNYQVQVTSATVPLSKLHVGEDEIIQERKQSFLISPKQHNMNLISKIQTEQERRESERKFSEQLTTTKTFEQSEEQTLRESLDSRTVFSATQKAKMEKLNTLKTSFKSSTISKFMSQNEFLEYQLQVKVSDSRRGSKIF